MTRTEKVAVQRSVAATPAAHMPEPCRSPPSFSAAESAVFFLQTGDKHNSSEKVAFHMKETAHFLVKLSKMFQNHVLPHHECVTLTKIVIFI